MMTTQSPTKSALVPDTSASPEERLERGEVVFYPICPFRLPEGEDRQFLFEQQLRSRVHKNIGYDPHTGKASGFKKQSPEQATRLRDLLAEFARTATQWLANTMPRYAQSWQLDRVSYRPEEEATRRLRLTARNDLLHVDAFPSRPTNGQRILRLFANINLTEPRIWVTSDPFPRLLERFGKEAGLPTPYDASQMRRLGEAVLQIFRPGRKQRSVYDQFMLRFHNFLKAHEAFQERPQALLDLPARIGLAGDDRCDQPCGHARPVCSGALLLHFSPGTRVAGRITARRPGQGVRHAGAGMCRISPDSVC